MSTKRTTPQKLALFRGAFRGRGDIYGTREDSTGKARCVKSPIDDRVFMDHLRGKQPLGVYPLVENRVWFAAIDLDEHDPDPVWALYQLGHSLGLESLIEISKSKGWHLWFFADENGWPAELIRPLLHWMAGEVNKPGVEVFPKQDQLAEGGFGNFIFLPLDGSLVPKSRTIFVEPTRWLPPVSNNWDALAQRRRYSATEIKAIAESVDLGSHADRAQRDSHPLRRHRAANSGENKVGGCTDIRVATSISRNSQSGQTPASRGRGLPPCARRMLEEGVTQQQRVVCFRLAVHLWRIGVPEDLARVLLAAWAKKNQPTGGKRMITPEEIASQTRDGYSGRYRGYGCDDPAIAQYCEGRCPVLSKTTPMKAHVPATSRTTRPLSG